MGKPLSEKGRLIRQAIAENPEVGNTDLATLLNTNSPGHDVKPNDVAAQRQALNRLAQLQTEESDDSQPAESTAPDGALPPGGLMAEDLEVLLNLAHKLGGLDHLIRWLQLLRRFH